MWGGPLGGPSLGCSGARARRVAKKPRVTKKTGVITDHETFKLAMELYIINEGPPDNKVKTMLRGKVWQSMVVGKDASPHPYVLSPNKEQGRTDSIW